MAYPSYFQFFKTQDITKLGETRISDRLIVTHDKGLYFDWDDNERIELIGSNNSKYLLYNSTFTKTINEEELISNIEDSITSMNGNKIDISNISEYSLVIDINGDMGFIKNIYNEENNKSMNVVILTDTDGQIAKLLTITRIT